MNRKVFLLMLVLFLLSVFAVGCKSRGTVKKDLVTPQADVEATTEIEGTEGPSTDSSEIPPEGSARGKVFSEEVMHINLEDVRFDYDAYVLNAEAKSILAKNVEVLKDNPKLVVQIEGHCDERGTVEYNLALGQKRATAVRNYLVAAGIASSRIFTISYGKEKPVDPGHDEDSWSKNRRAHPVGAAE